jgi:hypothetical protein
MLSCKQPLLFSFPLPSFFHSKPYNILYFSQAESRIGVIFDLDETLLLANTCGSLTTKIDQARRMKQSSEMELSKFGYLSSLHPAQRNPEDESSVKLIQVRHGSDRIEGRGEGLVPCMDRRQLAIFFTIAAFREETNSALSSLSSNAELCHRRLFFRPSHSPPAHISSLQFLPDASAGTDSLLPAISPPLLPIVTSIIEHSSRSMRLSKKSCCLLRTSGFFGSTRLRNQSDCLTDVSFVQSPRWKCRKVRIGLIHLILIAPYA